MMETYIYHYIYTLHRTKEWDMVNIEHKNFIHSIPRVLSRRLLGERSSKNYKFPHEQLDGGKYRNHLLVTNDHQRHRKSVAVGDTAYPFSGNELLNLIERIQTHSRHNGAVYNVYARHFREGRASGMGTYMPPSD